ncbi:MAG: xanthine dehydrogenase family protein molybdopterin-binding subunit [Thermodesulfobacteriota bacterium]|nr:xanthine dehydrogenase family protein molybdopterin-binding subunit [Thermodesulfobacteriota bacterium]
MKQEYSVIGRPASPLESDRKLTGKLKFTPDITLPRILHGKVLRSPHAHARILNIDTKRAKKLPGVKAVVTGKDTLGKKYGFQWARVGDRWLEEGIEDKYPICMDKVFFVGDEVAAVAATSEDIAEEALDLIDVEYDPLPAVFDPEEAMKEGAPQLHEHAPNNIFERPRNIMYGDVEKGFGECDHIREDVIKLMAPIHAFIEPICSIAQYDSISKTLEVWSTTEVPQWTRTCLSELLDMSLNNITVNKPLLGGGFGGKTLMFPSDYIASLLSIKSDRPVKITLDMNEVFMANHRRCEYIFKIKTGVKKDGTLIARDVSIIGNGGAYCLVGILLVTAPVLYLHVPLKIPHFRANTRRIYTNTPPCSVLRGAGHDAGTLADNIHMDLIAHDLNMDPIEIKMKNLYKKGDITPLGWNLRAYSMKECLEKVMEESGWKEKWGKLPPNHGIGIGDCVDIVSMGIPPGHHVPALIKLHDHGKITLTIPSWEMGQSYDVECAMIASEVLGTKVEDFQFGYTGTNDFPVESGGPNEGTFGTQAIYEAAQDAKKQLFDFVAHRLECNEDDLESRDRRIFVKGSPDKGMGFFEAVKEHAIEKGVPIIGRGSHYCGKELMAIFNKERRGGDIAEGYTYGAYVAELEVDPETGNVKVHKMTCAWDVGQAINTLAVEQQLEGGALIGMGTALWEGLIYGKDGSPNTSFLKYKLCRSVSAPDIKPVIVEIPEPTQCFGMKSCGMGSMHPAPGALYSAVLDATGAALNRIPLTPNVICDAIKKKGKGRKNNTNTHI